jgi:uncharacterized protein (TIGR02679 family)
MSPLPRNHTLPALITAPALAPLLARLRQRLERGQPLTGKITLANLAPAQREAIDTLFARAPAAAGATPRTTTISLDELSSLLAESGYAPDLRAAIEHIIGPVENKPAARKTLATEWHDVFAQAPSALRDHLALAPLLAQLQTTGLLKRLSRSSPATARALLGQLARVTTALPAGGHPLPALAAAHLGNAHALDPGEPLASLTLRAAAGIAGIPFPETQDAETRRDLWASVGVLCDELSTPVCVLNLPVSGNRLQTTTPLLRLLAQARDDAEPLPITLRLLLRYPLSQYAPFANRDIYVCENPTIMALAADRLGPRCAPLACVNGQYATPAKILLRQLDAAGARLHYHGDFDTSGMVIARRIFASHAAARPWRMNAADYLAAPKGKHFAGAAALSSPWDPTLAAAMRQHKRAIHEEAVAEQLLRNLGT